MSMLMALLRRFSIRWRMRGAMLMVTALFLLVGLAGAIGGQQLGSTIDRFMSQSVRELHTLTDLRASLGLLRRHEKDIVIEYEDSAAVARHREAWNRTLAAIKTHLATLLEGARSADDGPARAAVESIDAYAQASAKVLDQVQAGAYDNAKVADRMLARAKQHIADAEARVDEIDRIITDEAAAAKAAFDLALVRAAMVFGAVLATVILVVVPLTLANSRSITAPMQEARDVALAIAQGDLGRAIDTRGIDESADLMRALEHMQQALCGIVGQVRLASDSIATSTAEVAAGNVDLSQRTEQAASSLQQTASSMEQLTGTVQQSAESAAQARQLALSAAEVAQRGGSVVSQVVSTMEEINNSSRRIADIIGTIDGIAFQTNILALNAAVEAARAGEQGRGFAVVAGEVRSLAQRSAEAAREIKSLIGASVERVEAGSRLVRDAGGTMDEIVASVQRVSDMINEISAAAADQSSGIGQVNQAVVQLDQMTQQNAALVEQSAAAAQSLQSQAGKLTGTVASFRLAAVALSATPATNPASPTFESPPLPPAAPRPAAAQAPAAKAARPAPMARRAQAPPSTAAPVVAQPVAVAATAGGDDWETF